MFIIHGTYLKPIEEVERVLPAHREFLDKHYATGTFICSGPMNPRVGGVILCGAESREEVDAIMSQDPFLTEEISRYSVIEFNPTKASAEFQQLLGR